MFEENRHAARRSMLHPIISVLAWQDECIGQHPLQLGIECEFEFNDSHTTIGGKVAGRQPQVHLEFCLITTYSKP